MTDAHRCPAANWCLLLRSPCGKGGTCVALLRAENAWQIRHLVFTSFWPWPSTASNSASLDSLGFIACSQNGGRPFLMHSALTFRRISVLVAPVLPASLGARFVLFRHLMKSPGTFWITHASSILSSVL